MTEAMPRKTRKEKIRNQLRNEESNRSLVFSYQSTGVAKPTINQAVPGQILAVRKDILKTVVLGSVFILFEFGLAIFSKKLGW